MSATNDGGPAFPLAGSNDYSYPPEDGMTLRDWFAGMAMQGASQFVNQHEDHHSESLADIARESYKIADAMLAARERKETP